MNPVTRCLLTFLFTALTISRLWQIVGFVFRGIVLTAVVIFLTSCDKKETSEPDRARYFMVPPFETEAVAFREGENITIDGQGNVTFITAGDQTVGVLHACEDSDNWFVVWNISDSWSTTANAAAKAAACGQ